MPVTGQNGSGEKTNGMTVTEHVCRTLKAPVSKAFFFFSKALLQVIIYDTSIWIYKAFSDKQNLSFTFKPSLFRIVISKRKSVCGASQCCF